VFFEGAAQLAAEVVSLGAQGVDGAADEVFAVAALAKTWPAPPSCRGHVRMYGMKLSGAAAFAIALLASYTVWAEDLIVPAH